MLACRLVFTCMFYMNWDSMRSFCEHQRISNVRVDRFFCKIFLWNFIFVAQMVIWQFLKHFFLFFCLMVKEIDYNEMLGYLEVFL